MTEPFVVSLSRPFVVSLSNHERRLPAPVGRFRVNDAAGRTP